MSGNLSLARYMIDIGANVNLTFGTDHTYVPFREMGTIFHSNDNVVTRSPLQMAALCGNLEMMRLLITNGALLDHHDAWGLTVFFYLWVLICSRLKKILGDKCATSPESLQSTMESIRGHGPRSLPTFLMALRGYGYDFSVDESALIDEDGTSWFHLAFLKLCRSISYHSTPRLSSESILFYDQFIRDGNVSSKCRSTCVPDTTLH